MTNRLFSKPKPRELLTSKESCAAWGQIQKHRKLKNAVIQPSRWPERIHGLLTAGLFLAFFTVLFGVWLALTCEGSGESKDASECFSVAVWACLAGACLVLAKCYWNSKYPLP